MGSMHVCTGYVDTRAENAACGAAAAAAAGATTVSHASGSCQMTRHACDQSVSPGVAGGRGAALRVPGASGGETAKAEGAFQGLLEAHDAVSATVAQ